MGPAMIQKSPPEQVTGCFFSLAGALLGGLAGCWHLARYAASIREANPDAVICGNPAIGALFGGAMLGAIGGLILNAVLQDRSPPSEPPR